MVFYYNLDKLISEKCIAEESDTECARSIRWVKEDEQFLFPPTLKLNQFVVAKGELQKM